VASSPLPVPDLWTPIMRRRFEQKLASSAGILGHVWRVLGLALLIPFGIADAQERLVYASPLPQNEYGAYFGRVFAEEVALATSGDVEILVRQNGVLGLKGSETLAAVRDGLVHIADMQMNQQIGEETIFGIESLPCLARNFEDLRILRNVTRPHFENAAQRHNQKIFFMYPMPRQSLFAKKDVSVGVGELQGLQIRTIDKNGTEFFSRLGAAPIQMPWAEVTPALSTGLLDGVSTSPTTAVSGTFWDFLSHATELHWQMNSFMTTINMDAWERIPAQHRVSIENIAQDIESRLWEAAINADNTAAKTLRERGVTFSQPSAKLEEQMQLACAAITAEYLEGSDDMEASVVSKYLSILKTGH
jgi:TRAP-type transport system periplasmic protein